MSLGAKKLVVQLLSLSILLAIFSMGICYGVEMQSSEGSILGLSMEDLLNVEVTSVSKRPQSLQDASAAIFVITAEDLHRLGVTNIPDALRLVPGIQVGRIDSNKWAVTSRGFNGRFGNKLLVLIDGRNVYTTSFSGVYWEVQDPLLEDIDRIEIIRGPGSTLWGANAVNGVINIITKHAADTQGGLIVAGAGDVENGFTGLRWGTELSKGTYAKVYCKAFSRGEFQLPDGQDAGDDWKMLRGGFQLDSQSTSSDAWALSGDLYNGRINQQITMPLLEAPYLKISDDDARVSGGHLMGRVTKTLSPKSEVSFQVYFDRAVREESVARQATSTVDYDFQHQFSAARHMIVWGLGYRYINDVVSEQEAYLKSDGEKNLTLFSAFLQDEIELVEERLALTVGSKFEHNDFTGLEVQPSLRLIWKASNEHRIWAAVSRAVRTPMRAEIDFEVLTAVIPSGSQTNPGPLPVGVMITGNEDFESEDLLAYEVGYRFARSNLSVDLAAFYNDYSNLQDNKLVDVEVRYWEDPMYVAQPAVFNNSLSKGLYGAELAVAWQTNSWLRWDLAYSYLAEDKNSFDNFTANNAEKSPDHMMSLVAGLQPLAQVNVSAGLRYVDECVARGIMSLEDRSIPHYTTLDARIGWYFRPNMELSLVGQNLLEDNHREYVAESFTLPTEVPRSLYMKLQWEF